MRSPAVVPPSVSLQVDEFAPKTHCTTWMSLVQAGVPLGIMAGYTVSGFLAANTNFSWRVSFYIQSFLLLPAAIGWFLVPRKYIDPQEEPASPQSPPPPSLGAGAVSVAPPAVFGLATVSRHTSRGMIHLRMLLGKVKKLVLSPIWVCTAMSLCALYFVVTGVQLWITSYLRAPPISVCLRAPARGSHFLWPDTLPPPLSVCAEVTRANKHRPCPMTRPVQQQRRTPIPPKPLLCNGSRPPKGMKTAAVAGSH